MKLHTLHIALFLSLFGLTHSAFAIDQVILKNGLVVEGKILSDVPNRHVDIQLVNGTKRRFQQTEVASLERDVPSNVDSHMSGNSSEVYFGVNLGIQTISNSGLGALFNWGARFGVNVTQLGDFSKLAFGVAYNYSSLGSGTSGTTTVSASYSELMAQVLFRKVANTGIYFGPELGLAFVGASASGIGSISVNKFGFGVVAGYDYYFNDGFSLGPEFHYTTNDSLNAFKVLLGGTFHF